MIFLFLFLPFQNRVTKTWMSPYHASKDPEAHKKSTLNNAAFGTNISDVAPDSDRIQNFSTWHRAIFLLWVCTSILMILFLWKVVMHLLRALAWGEQREGIQCWKYNCRSSLMFRCLPVCRPILILRGMSGMCLILNVPTELRMSRDILAISAACLFPFRFGSPEATM